jgi:hypothetical protein
MISNVFNIPFGVSIISGGFELILEKVDQS